MKRIRLLVVAGVIAAALPLGMNAAGATGDTLPANYVEIRDLAQFSTQGTYIEVGLTVKCKPNGNPLHVVEVVVTQSYPETPYPQGAIGIGAQNVVCDNTARSVAATVPPGLFDAGRAYAVATLDPLSPRATDKEWITIVHV
jgi:hypothetical protein